MKNTFAAYRHIPTDKIHILDLDLFTNQQISNEDGATSLACEYLNEDGEPEMAIIWSGLQDEPGVTYLPIPDDQNADIIQNWFASFAATIVLDLEYRFESSDLMPEHVVATVEIIEPANS